MTLKERISAYCKLRGFSVSQFERAAQLPNGTFKAQTKSLREDGISKILHTFPDINRVWLLTGEGDMLSQDRHDAPMPQVYRAECRMQADYQMVPVYNFDAVGGMHVGNNITDAPAYIERHIAFPGAHRDDICVHVTGCSMTPTYTPGSIILVRKVEDWQEYFGYGHCFMLFLTDGRRILKEVQRYDEDPKNYVLCVSHNKDIQPEELPKRMIAAVYKVVMTLSNEGF